MIFNNSIYNNNSFINMTHHKEINNDEIYLVGIFILVLVSILVCYCISVEKHQQIDCVKEIIYGICCIKRKN